MSDLRHPQRKILGGAGRRRGRPSRTHTGAHGCSRWARRTWRGHGGDMAEDMELSSSRAFWAGVNLLVMRGTWRSLVNRPAVLDQQLPLISIGWLWAVVWWRADPGMDAENRVTSCACTYSWRRPPSRSRRSRACSAVAGSPANRLNRAMDLADVAVGCPRNPASTSRACPTSPTRHNKLGLHVRQPDR